MKTRLLFLPLVLFLLISISGKAQCVLSAGADKNYCIYPRAEGDSVDVFASVTGGTANSYKWTSNGSGYFTSNSSYGSYKYSAAELAAGFVTLTVTSTGGTCNGLTDQITVTLVSVKSGPDTTTCEKQVQVWGSAPAGIQTQWQAVIGSGTFADSSAKATRYTASQSDIERGYALVSLKTVSLPCFKSDTTRITFNQALLDPILNKISCGNSVKIDGHSYNGTLFKWTTSGTGSFSTTTKDSTIYTASPADIQSGNVSLTLAASRAGCTYAPATATSMISFISTAQVNAGPDVSICGNSVSLAGSVEGSNSGVWSSSGTGTFAHYPSYLINTYAFSAADKSAGSVTLTLSSSGNNSGCSVVTDQKKITIVSSNAITVEAGPDQTSAGAITLNGNISGSSVATWTSSGSGVFSPSATMLNPTYTPSASDLSAGFVQLTLSSDNGTCGMQSDQLFVTLGNYSTIVGTVMAGSKKLDKGDILLFRINAGKLELFRRDSITPGDNGIYMLEYLPPGNYLVYAAPSSVSAYYTSYLPTYYTSSATWESAQQLTLNNSALMGKNIQLTGFTSAQPGWNTGSDTIAGSVYNIPTSPKARLIGSSDVPVAGAAVYLRTTSGAIIAYTRTDVKGAYVFKKVLSTNYLITTEYGGKIEVGNPIILAADGAPSTIENGSLFVSDQRITSGILSSRGHTVLNAYPNPANEYVLVSMNTSQPSCIIQVMDETGTVHNQYTQQLSDNSPLRIPIADLHAGLYFLKITSGEDVYVAKVLKQ